MRDDLLQLREFLRTSSVRVDALTSVDLTRPDPEEPRELTAEEQAELVAQAMQNLNLPQSADANVGGASTQTNAQVSHEVWDERTEVGTDRTYTPESIEEEESEEENEESPQELLDAVFSHNSEESESPIPTNERPVVMPPSIGVREELVRFSDAEWFSKVQEKRIILAGVGGIGSNLAIILAKLNPETIYLFDHDHVEAVNMAGQLYRTSDIGEQKVDALARTIIDYTNYHSIVTVPRFYMSGETIVEDIMICGFDSMRARKAYYYTWKTHVAVKAPEEKKDCLFIDGRLTADEFQIFCITGDDTYYMHKYESEELFDDWQAPNLPCSFKQTGFLAQMIASYMANLLVNFCANQVNPLRNMSLPFKTSYRSDMMYLSFVK